MTTDDDAQVRLAPPPPRWVLHTMNRVMRPLLRSPLAKHMNGVMLLEFRGRRTGRTYRVPVNCNRVEGVLMAFTEAPWRRNFEGGAPVTLVHRGVAHDTRGELVAMTPEQMGRAVRESLDHGGSAQRMGIKAVKGHRVTAEELATLGPALGTAVVRFDLRPPA